MTDKDENFNLFLANTEWDALDLLREWQEDKYFLKANGYDLLEPIGKGGVAEVWRVLDKNQNKMLACKVMAVKTFKRMGLSLPMAFKVMLKEVDVLKRLRHQNIANFEALLKVPDKRTCFPSLFAFIFIELCDGCLADQIKSWHRLSETQSHRWFEQIAQGLQYLHRNNVSHMDIKPQNILYQTIESDFVYKLSDFGLSLVFESTEPNVTKATAGTANYAAPELFSFGSIARQFVGLGASHETKPCDIYSLGISLAEAMFGIGGYDWVVRRRMGARDWLERQIKNLSSGVNISHGLIDLLTGMAELDPKQRLTIEQVLQHPWVMSAPIM